MTGKSPRTALAALGVTAVVVGTLLVTFHDKFWYAPDEGNYAHVAERVTDGEVLHHQVQDVHSGYINHINALAMQAFGKRLVSMRYPLAAGAYVMALLASLLLIQKGTLVSIVGGAASVGLGLLLFLNPSANWYALYASVCLLAWLHWTRSGWQRIVGAGVLVGLVAGFRQLTGAIVGLGLLTWLLIESRQGEGDSTAAEERPGACALALWLSGLGALAFYLLYAAKPVGFLLFGIWPLLVHLLAAFEIHRSNGSAIKLVGLLSVGVFLAFAPIFVSQLLGGGLGPWWRDTVGSALALSAFRFPDHYSWSMWIKVASAGSLAVGWPGPLIGALLLLLMLSFTMLGGELALRFARGERLSTQGPIPFLALYYGLVPLHFPSSAYLAFATPMVVIGLLSLSRRGRRAVVLALALPVSIYFMAAQPTERSFRQILSGDRSPWLEVQGLPRTGLRVAPEPAGSIERVTDMIRRATEPHQPIFVFPSRAEFYFLSDRRNPTRFFNTALGLRDSASTRVLLQQFEARPPAAVIYNRADHYSNAQSDAILDWVEGKYARVDSVGAIVFYLYMTEGGE